jgi:RHS repeat-associated protein
MPGRKFTSATQYRYGFNGKEEDDEVKGDGNQQDYGMRIYDPRLGRFLSVDPIAIDYPWLTPYQFASNRPIASIDIDGLEAQGLPAPAPSSSASSTPTIRPAPTLRPIRGGAGSQPGKVVQMYPPPTIPTRPANVSYYDDVRFGPNSVVGYPRPTEAEVGLSSTPSPAVLTPEQQKQQQVILESQQRLADLKRRQLEGYSPETKQKVPQLQVKTVAQVNFNIGTQAATATNLNNPNSSGTPQRQYEQYALVASQNGLYPVFDFGKGQTGEIYLKQGEVWKYGTTINPDSRYTNAFLENTGAGLTYQTEYKGTEKAVLSMEYIKLFEYKHFHGNLPPGNTKMR